jgi:hypothetical protein
VPIDKNVYGDSSDVEGRLVFETTYTVSGIGSFSNVQFNGTYSPGQSPGITHLIDTAFGDDATVEIELGGLNVGAEYDRIVFEGTSVSLDGDLIDTFMPSQSDTFQIFDFSSLTSGNTGQFNTLTLPSLSDALSWDHSDLYSSGTLSVIPEPATLTLLAVGTLLTCSRRRWYRQL